LDIVGPSHIVSWPGRLVFFSSVGIRLVRLEALIVSRQMGGGFLGDPPPDPEPGPLIFVLFGEAFPLSPTLLPFTGRA